MELAGTLGLSGLMVVVTVLVHFFGLAGLVRGMRFEFAKKLRDRSVVRQAATILGVVFGLFALHGVEIAIYAALYVMTGEFQTLEAALYFSTGTFTTLGFGDVLLEAPHRMLAATEALVGFLLIGWSTAFLVSVTARIGILEATIAGE